MNRDQRPERRLAALDLLADERLGDEVEPGAAVRLRDDDAEDPELRHPLDQVEVELVLDVVGDCDRQDPLVDEVRAPSPAARRCSSVSSKSIDGSLAGRSAGSDGSCEGCLLIATIRRPVLVQGSTVAHSRARPGVRSTRARSVLVGGRGLVALVAVGVGFAFAGSPDTLAPGTEIAGVDVGGLTLARAAAGARAASRPRSRTSP